ncbi:MAG: hypothetical protein WKF66_16705 [Pedobacter sp.]
MKLFYEELFQYSHYFNQKLGDVFVETADRVSEKAIKIYNHILTLSQSS